MKTRIVKCLVNYIADVTKGNCYYLFKGRGLNGGVNYTKYFIINDNGCIKRFEYLPSHWDFVESSSQQNPMSKAQFKNCVLRRVGKTNHRFTFDSDYEISGFNSCNEPYINDDEHRSAKPIFRNDKDWELIHKSESVEIKPSFKNDFVRGVDEAATLDKTAFFNIDPRKSLFYAHAQLHDRSMSRMMRQSGKTFELAHDLAVRDMREHIENTMLYRRSMIDTGYWKSIYEDLIKPTTKENETMRKLKIETKTLINGNDAADYSVDSIVEMIQEQEQQIEKLKQVKSESKVIKKLVDQCQQDIDELIAVLDARDE